MTDSQVQIAKESRNIFLNLEISLIRSALLLSSNDVVHCTHSLEQFDLGRVKVTVTPRIPLILAIVYLVQ